MRQPNEHAPATLASAAMQTLTLADVMAEMRELPSLPAAVDPLISALRNDAVSTDHLAHDIGMDPALAARVLRVANSPFYGVQKKVASIHVAIVVLGLNAVGSLVMAASVTGYFKPTTDSGLDLSHFWRHSIGVALSARALARGTRRGPEVCFTAGLLHDSGRLLLASLRPLLYQQVMAWRNEQDCLISAAESHVLGFDHAELGAALAERWRFPAEIVDAVANHHHPAGNAHATLVDVVHAADAIAHALDLAGEPDELVPPLDAAA